MHRPIVLTLTLAALVGCGGNPDAKLQEAFPRFVESFHLRLQHQYFEPRTAPADVVIKLSDKPVTTLAGTRGTVVFTQAETTNESDRDVRITLIFTRQAKRWELTSAQAQVIAQAKRGKQKEPVAAEPTNALADETYGPRFRAALATTPPE
jgi:hypothetical protein